MLLFFKIQLTFRLIWYYLWTIPIRFYRLPAMLFCCFKLLFKSEQVIKKRAYYLGLLFLILDLIGVPEFLEIVFLWFKRDLKYLNFKPTNQAYRDIAQQLLDMPVIEKLSKINANAGLLTRQGSYAFVSIFTIHYYKYMSHATYAHELIHLWQYTRFGSAYIPLALYAQISEAGYDYGGYKALQRARATGQSILTFNFEQQGDILADYYRLKYEIGANCAVDQDERLQCYQYFVDQIRTTKIYRWTYL